MAGRFSFRFLSLFLTAAVLLLFPAAEAETPPETTGPSLAAGEGPIAPGRRIARLRDAKERLTAFLSGDRLIEVPPAALFTVDLSDEEAIARRVKELSAKVDRFAAEGKKEAPLPANDHGKPPSGEEEVRQLEADIDRLRLAFLSLPKDKREALIAAQQAGLVQSDSYERLARERLDAERQKEDAARSLEIAEEQAGKAGTASLRELAAQRALVEKTRQDLAALTIRWTSLLQERTRIHRETAEEISSLAAVLAREEPPARIREAYLRSAAIWRRLVDRTFANASDPDRYEPVPDLPAYPRELAGRMAGEPEADGYRRAYEEIRHLHRSLVELREKRFREERDSLYRLLLQSGRLRSLLLREGIRTGGIPRYHFSKEYLADLAREIRIVPHRLIAAFQSMLIDFRGKEASGFSGLLGIAWQTLLLLALLLVPFAIYRLLQYASRGIDRTRCNLIGTRAQVPWACGAALFLQRINPYFSWVAMLAGVWIAKQLVEGTDLAEIGAVLPYLAYYIGYRIFRILIASTVGVVAYSGASHGASVDRNRIQNTARHIGIFFFSALAILHATETVVGKSHFYNLVFALMLFLGTFLCALAARQWRKEIGENAERLLPETIGAVLKNLCLGSLSSWFASLPVLTLLVAVMAAHRMLGWASRFDFVKRIAAELFRRRLEGASDKGKEGPPPPPEGQLPEEYLQWFRLHAPVDPDLLVEPGNGIADTLRSIIRSWEKEETEEHSVALYGDKGSGKSSLFQMIGKEYPELRILPVVVPPKLCTREAVHSFFGDLLQADLNEGAGQLVKKFSEGEKTVLLVDDAHNLFLGALGGFEGYRSLIDLINARTKTLFWCAALNRRSWHYLAGVFGRNQFFRNVVEVPPWSDGDIRNLIMTRHRKTAMRLSYDAIIRAAHSPGDFAAAAELEEQFFRLLWDQSRGNPRAALLMWISSLTPVYADGLRVGIPRPRQLKGLEKVGDDSLFVYSAIIRHENLSTDEIVTTTNLPEGLVRHSLRIGMENGALVRSADGRYRVTPDAQFFLSQLLERRNFLYE